MRHCRLRMPDDTIRSVMVDENQPVANLMVIICTKLGITNHDEYSLIATGKHTLNGRRRERQDGRIVDQKMEQLKKKLKTDEDLAWVDHSKTLDEQEIHEDDVVLLRRRFFYSDQNIDTRDPLQLGLLYVQTRDAILSGTHPVTLDGAAKFAGIQCQAQLGDFMEGKTTQPGYLNLKDYLPADYAKVKRVERKIFSEHKKFYGLSELEAKAKYISEARSLPTYGVTFFLVKEKVAGKNKLVPRLLGITKDCVMRVDADTKAILKTWPLTTVKRWAPSENSFTLDFGDYSDSYYSVQTSEGEQISQLIAGYIDIILRRRKAKDHFGIEGDEGATMIEDSVAPSRATIIQNQPAATPRPPSAAPSLMDLSSVAGPTVQKLLREEGPRVEPPQVNPALEVKGKAEIGYESRPVTQYVTNYEPSYQQQDLKHRLEQAQDAVEDAQKVLDRQSQTEIDRSRFEASEVVAKKRKLSSKFAEINAATSQLVAISAIPEEELNYTELNQAVETVATSLPTVAKEVKIVASLMEDEESGERLVDAARRLCKAFSDLLYAAEPGPTVARQSLISAASRVGDATQALLYTINSDAQGGQAGLIERDDDEAARESADILLSLAKSVANSAAALVLKAKDVAGSCQSKDLRDLVIGSATQCALATSQMVATAKIVAPTISDSQCKRQLLGACQEVRRAVEGIQAACQRALRDETRQCEVDESAERVRRALDELETHINTIQQQLQQARQTQQRRTPLTSSNTNTNTNNRQRSSQNQTQTTNKTTTIHRIVDEHSGRPLDSQEDLSSNQNRAELMHQARNLARATTQLIQDAQASSTLGRSRNDSRGPNYYEDDQFQRNQSYISRELPMEQQQQQREHQERTSVKTITTTLYDESYERGGRRDERPISMYEHEQQQPVDYYNTTNNDNLATTRTTTTTTTSTQNTSSNDFVDGQQAEAAISGIVGDLDSTIVFATAGSLRQSGGGDGGHLTGDDSGTTGGGYLYHRESVLRCAKALVEDTRPLVASTASDQAQLARAAQESVLTMSRLASTVKASAASLGPGQAESQVALIRSVREVAVSLAELIGSTKSALGCDSNDPRLMDVKESAKSMVTSVTSLLRTVKSVEDEQQRACRALETTIEAIEQEIASYNASCPLQAAPCAPDELARAGRPVTLATAKSVSAASSGQQDEAIVAANMGRKAVGDLLGTTLGAAQNAESFELRQRCQEAGRECAQSYKRLVELLHRLFQQPGGPSSGGELQVNLKQELIQQSKRIASCVTELVKCSELLKGTQQTHNWAPTTTPLTSANDGQQQRELERRRLQLLESGAPAQDDPTVIAESELLGAASSIDAAARKLENLKPRVTSVKLPHEEMNFDEIILEAAKSIIEATAALLRAASASQRELLVDGRLDETETFYASDNNQWSEGLVSAARMVAAATHSLVEAANALVQGQASEERLISAAKQVASSTNQLLVACKVKAEPDSRTLSRLASAGNQVKRATDNLVRAAQQAIEHDEEQSLIISNRKVSGIAQEISAREQILKKEKELQVAKTQLMAIRKAKYANRPDDYQGYGGSLD